MKALLAGLLLLHSSLCGVLAQTTLAAALAELPSCAVLCLETAIQGSPCSATNTTCTCADAPFNARVTLCVTANCTVTQGLATKNITENLCNAPIRDKSRQSNILSDTFAALSAAAILFRVASKLVTGAEIGLDDHFITATFVMGVPSTVLQTVGLTNNGLGRDIWTVRPDQITTFLRSFYVMALLYFAQLATLKLSILFFYLRIFPERSFRKIIWSTIIFDVVFGVFFVVGGVFQCHPISYYWNQWDGEHRGSCLNINAVAWSNAAISIVLDVWMLGLAISQLVHLQIHWKKKVGVGLMFAVGTFVTVVSILRLQSLLQLAKSTNVTWDNLAVTQWSTVEINVGIICACMPSMRVLLVRMFPRILGSTQRSMAKYSLQNSHTNRLGTNASVGTGRGKDLPALPTDNTKIMYSQSYDVDLEDETRLVPLTEMPPAARSGPATGRSRGSSFGD